jgi:hypothetical protein
MGDVSQTYNKRIIDMAFLAQDRSSIQVERKFQNIEFELNGGDQ